jgi:hypothetical protein
VVPTWVLVHQGGKSLQVLVFNPRGTDRGYSTMLYSHECRLVAKVRIMFLINRLTIAMLVDGISTLVVIIVTPFK